MVTPIFRRTTRRLQAKLRYLERLVPKVRPADRVAEERALIRAELAHRAEAA